MNREDGRGGEADAGPGRCRTSISAAVDYFFIDGSEGGYVVLPRASRRAAGRRDPAVRAGLEPAARAEPLDQAGAPLALGHLSLDVSIALARDAAEAAAAVARLRGG